VIDHADARELLSARLDGELPEERAPELDVHLTTCAECRAFFDDAMGLRALIAELPREEPGELFARRRAPSRFKLRLAPAIAAALIVVLFLVLGSPPGFKVPVADAARALTTIRTFYAEREVTQGGETIREKIWFQAPGFLRIERKTARGTQIIVERPGARYEQLGTYRTLTTGLPPDVNVLPEPLSPSIALLGTLVGPGPVIDGRQTLRYELDLGQNRTRTADVDAERFTALGTTESLVLSKEAAAGGNSAGRKRVLDFRINEPIDASTFTFPSIPSIQTVDEGWRTTPSARAEIPPVRVPNGFRLITAATGPGGMRQVYARDSFGIQIGVSSEEPVGNTSTSSAIGVMVGGHHATIIEDLYQLPSISFELLGRFVTITAPMSEDGLVETARTMFFG